MNIGFLVVCLVALAYVAPTPMRLQNTPAKSVNTMAAQTSTGCTQGSEKTKQHVLATFNKLPLMFEANQGQADSKVKFLSHGRGYSLYLTANEAVMYLMSLQNTQRPQRNHSKSLPASSATSKVVNKPDVLRMKLVGANPRPQMRGLEDLPGKVNYFIGNDSKKWHTNVPTYAKVKCEQVYPGVDLVYHGNQQRLEYDFIIAPGVDPQIIRLDFAGAEEVEVDSQGNLLLHTTGGVLQHRKPIVYQKVNGVKQEVSGGYMLENEHQVSFHVGDYDTSQPLIIDPELSFSTYLHDPTYLPGPNGSVAREEGVGIALDNNGNIYIAGITIPFDDFLGNSNIFVAKMWSEPQF